MNECVWGPVFSARAGVAPKVAAGDASDLRLPVLATFSSGGPSGRGCDHDITEKIHFAGLASGVEMTVARFDARFMPVFGFVWGESSDHSGVFERNSGLAFGVVLDFGLIVARTN